MVKTNAGEIDSDKIVIGEVFKNWFRVPNYQRQYVWGTDEVNELLNDIASACRDASKNSERRNSQYFLGTFVFQSHVEKHETLEYEYDQNDLLDGQQRLTTLWLMFAVMRDLADDEKRRVTCRKCVYQEEDEYNCEPEILRIAFADGVRDSVKEFAQCFVKPDGGTLKDVEMADYVRNHKSLSVCNMAAAIRAIRDFWKRDGQVSPKDFLRYLLKNVLMIYVSTDNIDDAFRLFTVLNNRGVQLRSCDILKTQNLAEIKNANVQQSWAAFWEKAEGDLGNDFDRFLNFIRTILVKEKAKSTLLNEFKEKIYEPKDGKTGVQLSPLLRRGEDTFAFIKRYLEGYQSLFAPNHTDVLGDYRFDNLMTIMQVAVSSSDWVPPLLRYHDKFKTVGLMVFFEKLVRKFIADWVSQLTPTDRIEQMNRVLREIDMSETSEQVLCSDVFKFDGGTVTRVIAESVYGRRYALVLALFMDYMTMDHSSKEFNCTRMSLEHILPQTPESQSQWRKDFSDEQREEWQDKIGNLIVISGAKNSSQGRLNFKDKKIKYFAKRVPNFAHSSAVMSAYDKWTIDELQANQNKSVELITTFFGIA